MIDTVFSSVGRHALLSLLKLVTTTDIFHHFFLDFSKSICESSFLVLLPLKSEKIICKIQSKIWKDICASSVSNLLLLNWKFMGNFYFFIATSKLIATTVFKFFVFVCSEQIFDRLYEEELLQTIELIALNGHIINI